MQKWTGWNTQPDSMLARTQCQIEDYYRMYRYSQRNPADDDALWDDPQQGGYAGGGYAGGRLPPGPPRRGGGWDDFNAPPPPPAPPPRRMPRASASGRRAHLAREIIETIVLTVVIFVAIRFSVQTFRVDGESMRPGLTNEEYVLVNKLAYLFSGPARGDVIVFHFPVNPAEDFIKRVIGLPGDTIQVTPTQIIVNGDVLKEPYISAASNASPHTFKLGANEYFVMGDNRPFSSDSRSWGTVPRNYIIGKATVVFWPLSNWEVIPTYSNVFSGVPAPPSS
ncbi:MAG TPA: signal peptidase I [Ktedonobacterales bacterium]|nr:signal peptidase I [Ktedonobacterales bacterium]